MPRPGQQHPAAVFAKKKEKIEKDETFSIEIMPWVEKKGRATAG